MASDLQGTVGGTTMMKLKNKMYRFGPDNCFSPGMSFIAGFSGNVNDMMECVDFYSNPDFGRPPRTRDMAMLILTEEKQIYYAWSPTKWLLSPNKHFAVGSGSHVALGAMEVGATPLAAVKAAAKVDPLTGMGFKTMKL